MVFPDFGGVGAADDLRSIVGALLTFVLIIAVLMLIVSAIVWAIASSTSNAHTATKARTGAWVALGTAALAGAGVAWVNFLLGVGEHL
ncbi:Membrane protein [Gulosibacter molinativorax]|nr:Membrane protein [Gulosibacter molinativorax]